MEEALLTEDTPTLLPSYQRPPVVEVAMTAHFNPVEGLHVGHLGAYWQSIRDRFPALEQHPPAPRQEPEAFGSTAWSPGIRIELGPAALPPRFWFLSQDSAVIVQIQQDRLVLNWRRVAAGALYPRYDFMRSRFLDELTSYLAFLEAEGLAPPVKFHGEILYVNAITSGESWRTHGEASLLFTQLRALPMSNGFLEQEDIRLQQRFTFQNPEGAPTGRLYVQIDPVVLFDTGAPGYHLTLTARGGESADVEDLLDFMGAGRDRIVRAFDAMTTSTLHEEWGKE